MAAYLIQSAESTYQGLYGMFNADVIESDSDELANLMAEDMSYDIISGYGEFEDSIEDEVQEIAERDDITSEYEIDALREEITNERLYYDWWKLKDGYTVEQYRKMLTDIGWEELKKLYAVEE